MDVLIIHATWHIVKINIIINFITPAILEGLTALNQMYSKKSMDLELDIGAGVGKMMTWRKEYEMLSYLL